VGEWFDVQGEGRFFASDNAAPVHPEAMRALEAANRGHAMAYGGDALTEAAARLFDELFGRPVHTFFAFNGTGANILALYPLVESFGAVICADSAHINTDETGAFERVVGAKLQTVPTPDGKLTPDLIASQLSGRGSMHHPQPQTVSIAQVSETGLVYTPGEIRAIADFCHENELTLHMDGARVAQAAAALGVSIAAITSQAGVDVLTFGGTKNGLMYGEAVIAFIDPPARALPYMRKQITQLSSKMRYIAAQYIAYLSGELCFRNARAANAMAKRLAEGLEALPGVEFAYPAQANIIFARIAPNVRERMLKRAFFHVMDEREGLCRIVTSFDTTREDVEGLIAAARGDG